MTLCDLDTVLTTGAGGMIGSYVDFGTRTDKKAFDITDRESVMRYVQDRHPSAIIHLAGATDMERCERERIYAYELNVRGTYNIAQAARSVGAVMVYASTSRVFRGDKQDAYIEDDIPDPETHYGWTKYVGELITASVAPTYIIARTSWVFGGGPQRDNKFFGKIFSQLDKPEIAALRDVLGSPTYGKDYIGAIKELLEKQETGIFHIANAGEATRFDIASLITAEVSPITRVRAVDRSYFASGVDLPANESISSKTIHLRPWKEALSEYVTDEWSQHFRKIS